MRFTKDDFEEIDGQWFVGHVVDIDGSPWVNEETLELVLEELNDGVSDGDEPVTFAVPNRKDIIFTTLMPENDLNYIHLN
jgi:hypothetical protein